MADRKMWIVNGKKDGEVVVEFASDGFHGAVGIIHDISPGFIERFDEITLKRDNREIAVAKIVNETVVKNG